MKNFTLKNILVLTAFLLIGAGNTNAQDNSKPTKDLYLSYFGNDSTNINALCYYCYGGDDYYTISCVIYNTDTIRINGKLYMYKAPQYDSRYYNTRTNLYFPVDDTLFLREEQESGRLYRYYRDYFGTGSVEKMICDMTLETGDTFVLPCCLGNEPYEKQYTVIEDDYVNGAKTITLADGWGEIIRFNEGIFPSIYPFYHDEATYWLETSHTELLCQHKDGVQVYYNHYYGCNPILTQVDENDPKQVSVSPTIINNNATITVKTVYSITDIILYDINGRATNLNPNKVSDNCWTVNTNQNLRNGLYLMIIKTNNGMSYEKIIKFD